MTKSERAINAKIKNEVEIIDIDAEEPEPINSSFKELLTNIN